MTTQRPQGTDRGFTLIEIMIVVAIIGILSTIALPTMQRALYRSRATERSYMSAAIHRAIEEIYRVSDRFPPDPGVDSLTGDYNPPKPCTTGKRLFNPVLDDGWRLLGRNLAVEGATYYSYRYVAWESGIPGATIEAVADLDGDGNESSKLFTLLRTTGVYLTVDETPAPGFEDQSGY
jgi:prepilin-type N-terminal cleavage/methylation domain-containing protein